MQITPFAQLRGDVASLDVLNQPGVANYLPIGQSDLARAMPAVGVEYRYPFIDVESWGTQTIEPIAQLILRPNETEIGKWPNEDAQSLVFDDTNLFRIDKFSGWDRVEGGGRANAGFEYTAQVNKAGTFNVLFGQSYQLFGLNSYTVGDITNTGLTAVSIKRSRITSIASPISRTPPTCSISRAASTKRHCNRNDSKWRRGPISAVGARIFSMAIMPRSPRSDS